MESFELGGRRIANDAPPLFLPDIGTFFNQDMSLAREMVAQLKEAGATVVKGEILHRVELCLDDDAQERYYDPRKGFVAERWRDLMARKVVPLERYAELFEHCRKQGLAFVLSVYDRSGADFARRIGATALKIASSNLVNQPLIDHVAGLGLPMLIDTGKASMEEIARAVQWAQDAGAAGICLQHSPLAPPTPLTEHNLRMLQTFRAIYGFPVGLSDHHAGEEMLYAATALGAAILEKGVCRDDNPADQDVAHALPLSQVAEAMRKCANIHAALGAPMRYLRADAPKHNQRMGLVAARALRAGDALSLESVEFAWPNLGIHVEHWELVRNWRARRDLQAGAVIRWQDVDPPLD
jgi:sialic acid synthase SpsE